MAGHGPPPKDPSQRRRRNAAPAQTKIVGKADRVPPLPNAIQFSASTRQWYATWAKSPQSSVFTPTDWQRLHMLAPLVDLYFEDPSKELMGEIRLNESLLGAAAADRMRLRWQVESGKSGQPEPKPSGESSMSERKKAALRLLHGEAG